MLKILLITIFLFNISQSKAESDKYISDPPKNLTELSSKYSAPYIEIFEGSFLYSGMAFDGKNYDSVNFQFIDFSNKRPYYDSILKPVVSIRNNGLRTYGLQAEDATALQEFVSENTKRYKVAERFIIFDNPGMFKVENDGSITFKNSGFFNGRYKKCSGWAPVRNFGDQIVVTKNIERNPVCLIPRNLKNVDSYNIVLPPEVYRSYTSNSYKWRNSYLLVHLDRNSKWDIDKYDGNQTLPVIAESFYVANDNGDILYGANIDQSIKLSEAEKEQKDADENISRINEYKGVAKRVDPSQRSSKTKSGTPEIDITQKKLSAPKRIDPKKRKVAGLKATPEIDIDRR